MAAALGLTPRQHSSGGKEKLLGISKRGDSYLRCLLIQGARAAMLTTKGEDDRFSRWIKFVLKLNVPVEIVYILLFMISIPY